ncbi:MAG: hypothetical protein ABR599_01050 [Gemmatimonadota bacterium]
MRILTIACKGCGRPFESGIPVGGEHLSGVKVRALEVCPACGTAAEYGNEDYREPEPEEPAPGDGDAFQTP